MTCKLSIKQRMAHIRITSREVAKELKMSETNFSLMATNKTKFISFWTIGELCRILNCTPNDLFELVDD